MLGVGLECFGRVMYSRRSWMPPPDGHGGKDAGRDYLVPRLASLSSTCHRA